MAFQTRRPERAGPLSLGVVRSTSSTMSQTTLIGTGGGTPLMWSHAVYWSLSTGVLVPQLLQHLGGWLSNTWRQKLVARLAKLASVD